MLAGLLQKIAKAGGKADIKSVASEARNAIRKNPRMKGDKEKEAITKINNAEKAAKNKITNRARAAEQEGNRKRYVNPNPAKRKQSKEERDRAATGRISAKTTTQRNKKEGVGSMVSYTSVSRAAGMRKAKADLAAGRITESKYEDIMNAIDRANAEEVNRASRRGSQKAADMKAKTPTTREAPFPMPAKSKGVKGLNYNKGGYANCGASVKATQQSTNMSYGGMARKR